MGAGVAENKTIVLKHYRWKSHCGGLYQTPMAAWLLIRQAQHHACGVFAAGFHRPPGSARSKAPGSRRSAREIDERTTLHDAYNQVAQPRASCASPATLAGPHGLALGYPLLRQGGHVGQAAARPRSPRARSPRPDPAHFCRCIPPGHRIASCAAPRSLGSPRFDGHRRLATSGSRRWQPSASTVILFILRIGTMAGAGS